MSRLWTLLSSCLGSTLAAVWLGCVRPHLGGDVCEMRSLCGYVSGPCQPQGLCSGTCVRWFSTLEYSQSCIPGRAQVGGMLPWVPCR